MKYLILVGLALAVLAAGCTNTQKGAAIGAGVGAGAGAIIGHQSGEEGEGALIGAAAGGLVGALIGDAIDEEEAQAVRDAQRNNPPSEVKVVPVPEGRYMCPRCGRFFPNAGYCSYDRRHLRSARFICPRCHRAFFRRGYCPHDGIRLNARW